jgi:hypothetical protein
LYVSEPARITSSRSHHAAPKAKPHTAAAASTHSKKPVQSSTSHATTHSATASKPKKHPPAP